MGVKPTLRLATLLSISNKKFLYIMVEKIIYFMVLPFLFYACSTIHNKKYFNFQKSLTEKRIKTDGYYYKNTDVYLGERRTYIMGRIFLDNGYFHLTGSSSYEDKCKNLNIDCVIKNMSRN
ncbi:hypothetical protein [Capnocytophaga cynodegmi]|uniref:hypothetical protein n=1 Tax=Capnocytophaga cynodegmi TaxID=28189 RepID=UPI0003607E16|nr:hypothetical protein [Capnocytophaga cynodegmi]CEN42292.1 hypothetical protein CCYN49044_90016 [Capnocytophaga cynodegmi]